MNLHEFQAKFLFREYGMPVPAGDIASTPEAAGEVAASFENSRAVVKAQVHAGGCGKAGGVKLVSSSGEASEFVKSLLGRNLVTFQTDAKGQPIHTLLIEETCEISRELYVGAMIDRASQRVTFMASTEGGMDIEKVATETPEKMIKTTIDPLVGLMPYQVRELAFALNVNPRNLGTILNGLNQLFIEKDLSLVEINPLVETPERELICLDGKINIDDNALFRHADLQEMNDPTQQDERELRAHKWDLNDVALDGKIGCMVNAAGLAMATMDMINLHGGDPANFLDVGGTATAERVAEALKIILSDSKAKGILINIFGGIVRCDLIAEGILQAVTDVEINVPLVVRLEGNRAKEGSKLLQASNLNLIAAGNLTHAAEEIVAVVEAHSREVV